MATPPIHLDEKRSSDALSRSRRRLDSEDLFRRRSENVRGVLVEFGKVASEYAFGVKGVDWTFGDGLVDAFVISDTVDDCVIVDVVHVAAFPKFATLKNNFQMYIQSSQFPIIWAVSRKRVLRVAVT